MTDPSPEAALAAVMSHPSAEDFGGPMVWHDIDDEEWTQKQREFITNCVNLIRTHGAHFAALAGEVERLRGLKFSDRNYAAMRSRVERAEAEREAAVRNEQRYLWLRSNASEIVWVDRPEGLYGFADFIWNEDKRNELDAAIEAAMQAKGEGNG